MRQVCRGSQCSSRGDLYRVPKWTEGTGRISGRDTEVSRGRSSRWSNDHPWRAGEPDYRAKGRTSNEVKPLSSSRDEQRKQTSLNEGPIRWTKAVKPSGAAIRAEQSPVRDEGKTTTGLWEDIWTKEDLHKALKRVERNRGAPGIDGMRVEELRPYLRRYTGWKTERRLIRSSIDRAR